jgi:hypothetical protein
MQTVARAAKGDEAHTDLLKLSKNPPLRISVTEKAPGYAGSGNEIFKNGGFSTASLCAVCAFHIIFSTKFFYKFIMQTGSTRLWRSSARFARLCPERSERVLRCPFCLPKQSFGTKRQYPVACHASLLYK